MKSWKIINVQGVWYSQLGMYGGHVHLSSLFDIGNDVVKEGVIWEMQPFYYQNEVWYGNILQFIITILRWIKLKTIKTDG